MISILLYNLSVQLYYSSVFIAASFSRKAKSWIAGRQTLFQRLSIFVPSAHGKRIWFHCASLGEFEQVRPLIEKIRKEYPRHILVLTFFSPSGFEAKRYYEGVDFVGYLPLDTRYNAKKFLQMLKPSLVIWVKYEYWYHMLHELHERQIPVVLISSVFRPDQVFFKWYGSLHRRILGFFSHIYVQNEESQRLLQTLHIASEVCTDTRFDTVYNTMSTHTPLENVASFKGDRDVFLAGSTWTKDADLICELINNDPFAGRFKYIIAPHDVSRENINYLIKKLPGKRKVLLSRLTIQQGDDFDIVIVDTIGKLSRLYHYGEIAYIGGGFNASIHNILEPAVYGMPVIFGPNHQKSDEAKTLLSHPEWHSAYTIQTYDDLVSALQSLLDNDGQNLHTGSARSKEYVQNHIGGTEKIYSYLTANGLL